jgi:hypothetical protein
MSVSCNAPAWNAVFGLTLFTTLLILAAKLLERTPSITLQSDLVMLRADLPGIVAERSNAFYRALLPARSASVLLARLRRFDRLLAVETAFSARKPL